MDSFSSEVETARGIDKHFYLFYSFFYFGFFNQHQPKGKNNFKLTIEFYKLY